MNYLYVGRLNKTPATHADKLLFRYYHFSGKPES